VAADKKIELVPIEVNVKDLRDLSKVHKNIGEPFGDSSIVNQFYLSAEARKHATVFLSGDGGDEAFAGYPEYIKTFNNSGLGSLLGFIGPFVYPVFNALMKKDSNFKQQLSKMAIGSDYLGAGIRNNFQEPVLLKLLNKKYRLSEKTITEQIFSNWDETKGLPLVKRMQLFDYKNYLEPDVLVKVDRATMANSIESRSPFLDYRLVELGLKIPNRHNVNKVQGKLLLRKLASKHLPKVVTESPKKGFSLPFKQWVNDDIRHQLIKLNKDNGHDIWDAETFRYVVMLPFESYDIYTIFWRVWMFEIWYREIFANKEVGELLPGR
jgi:asparagine synthase (glutamine-hydrolysing)